MEYKSLAIWSYAHPTEDLQTEYETRLNSPSTIKTGLIVNPILRGLRQNTSYELFMVITEQIFSLCDKITQNSKVIEKLIDQLPGIVYDQAFNDYLTQEIMNTNEIEGVKTTRKEVNAAIANRTSNKKVRLQSFARMYWQIKNQTKPQLNNLQDIRRYYDFLLTGEISQNDLPDGQYFRAKPVRIGDDFTTIHQPKGSEIDFINDLNAWLNFINSEKPALIKAFIGHYYFEYIHPFYDGNGRLGRFILCSYLGYKLDPLTALVLSKEINNNRKKYYKAFETVELPKNHAEITFFVTDIMKLLVKGQKNLLADLTIKKDVLAYGETQLSELKLEPIETYVLYLHLQAHLFNRSEPLADNTLYTYRNKFSKRAIRTCIDELTKQGILKLVAKSPRTHILSDDFIQNKLNIN